MGEVWVSAADFCSLTQPTVRLSAKMTLKVFQIRKILFHFFLLFLVSMDLN